MHKLRAVISLEQREGPEPNAPVYRVMRIRNTVDYTIGEFLDRKTVKLLCDSAKFDVKIAPGK